MFFIILGNVERRPVLLGTTNGPSGTRGSLETPLAAQRSTRYRVPLPTQRDAIAAEAI